MTRAQQMRDELLVQLYGSGSLSLSVAHVRKVARQQQFDFSEQEIKDGLLFLVGQGLAQELLDAGSGERRYQITSKGMIHFENER